MSSKRFKGFIIIFIAVCLIGMFANTVGAANTEEIPVFLNGELMQFDVSAVIVQGRTMVPLRAIFEALGAAVEWNPADRSIEAVRNGTTVGLVVDSDMAVKNGIEVPLDAPAMILNNRTMVPLRFVSEALGEKVNWDPAERQVYITTANGTPAPPLNGDGISVAEAPFRNVDPGWVSSLIYEHELISPRNICIGPGGDAFVYDTVKGIIYRVSRHDYAISEYLDLREYSPSNIPVMIGGMAWQPGAERFLLGIHNQIWYYDPAADEAGVLSPGLPGQTHGWSYFEVNPADDSFFASTQTPTPVGSIYRFNTDMTAELIVSGTHGAYQTAHVGSENALYYTETFPGTLKKVDLETLAVTTVLGNLGIPGSFEPISVALNPVTGVINVFSPPNGLQDVHGNRLDLDGVGAGMICWWDAAGAGGAMIMAQHAGANLIYFDVVAGRTPALTPYVNAMKIARNKAGDMLIDSPHDSGKPTHILKVDASGISDYYRDSAAALRALMNDASGNIYAAWSDGKINIITGPGTDSARAWADGVTNVLDMAHNPNSDKIVVLRHSGGNTVELVNIDIADPTSRNVLAVLQSDGILLHTLRVTCGYDGSSYVLFAERSDAPMGAFKILRFDTRGNQSTIHRDIFRDNRAITVPDLVFARESGLLHVSTIEDIRAYPVGSGVHSTFAISNGAVDIFALTEDKDGRIIGIQSGRVFQFEKR